HVLRIEFHTAADALGDFGRSQRGPAELRRRRVPDGRVLAGLPEPGRVLLPDVPAGLVLMPVVRPREHRPALIPDDLLRIEEPDSSLYPPAARSSKTGRGS